MVWRGGGEAIGFTPYRGPRTDGNGGKLGPGIIAFQSNIPGESPKSSPLTPNLLIRQSVREVGEGEGQSLLYFVVGGRAFHGRL